MESYTPATINGTKADRANVHATSLLPLDLQSAHFLNTCPLLGLILRGLTPLILNLRVARILCQLISAIPLAGIAPTACALITSDMLSLTSRILRPLVALIL
jgi:hypothetical protein